MTHLPITPVSLPSDLEGQENGKLDASLLSEINGGKLHKNAAKAWLTMYAAAKKDGVELKPTSTADTYRTYAIQLVTFKKRYSRIPRPGQTPKVWNGKKYWLKKGYAGAAVPGTSNHGWGLAIDVKLEHGVLDWLLKNAETYGFSWESQSENWHIRYVLGDKLPKVLAKKSTAAKSAEDKPKKPARKAAPSKPKPTN